MNPFDLRTALLARHAQHVVLIHFPIALFITGVAFDVLALLRRSRAAGAAAYYNLVAAALSVWPAVATGLLAWQLQLGGKTPRGNLRLHLVLALCSAAAISLVWWLHFRARSAAQRGGSVSRLLPQQGVSVARLALELTTVLLVAFTAHVGGFLSGVNAPG